MNLLILFPFIIVGFLALLVFLIYRSPLDLKIVMERTGTSSGVIVSASWSVLTVESTYIGGIGFVSLFFLGKKIVRRELSKKSGVLKSQEKVPGLQSWKDLLLQTLPLGSDVIRFLTAIFHHVTIRQIEGAVTIGLRNPADTGMLFGCFSAVQPLLSPCNRISLSIKPVFEREILEGHVMADFRISHPLFIPVLLLRMAMKPHARRLIRGVSAHKAGIAG
jgi:hypothetical protein